MFAEKALRLIAGLFIGAYVARYLGPAQYGLLNYVISLVSLFSILAMLGLDAIVIKALVENESAKDKLLGTAFVLKFLAALTVFIGFVTAVKISEAEGVTRSLIYVIAAGSLFEVFGVISFFFDSRAQSKYAVWSQMAGLTTISIARIILVTVEASIVWFAATYTMDLFILANGLVFFYTRKSGSLLKWQFDWSLAKDLLRRSWPLIIASLSVTVYIKIDQIMVKWMLGDDANGNYSVAARLSEMWNFIPIAICASVFPAILNAKVHSEKQYLSRLQRLYDLMVTISASIALLLTFFSHFVVTLLFGKAYEFAGDILSLYVWSSVFTFLGVANGKWIITENLQIFRMTSLVVAVCINIVLNYVLIKTIGLKGAAISTLISYAFAGYLSFLFTAKTRPMFISMTRSFNPLRLFGIFSKRID